LLHIAETVSTIGFLNLKQAFTMSFPTVTYTSFNAKCLILQMPLVCIRLDHKFEKSECILIEYHDGVNYKNLLHLLQNVIPESSMVDTKMDKSLLKALLGLCQSDRERECLRYAVYKVFEQMNISIREKDILKISQQAFMLDKDDQAVNQREAKYL
jgi:hypothetical protein